MHFPFFFGIDGFEINSRTKIEIKGAKLNTEEFSIKMYIFGYCPTDSWTIRREYYIVWQ